VEGQAIASLRHDVTDDGIQIAQYLARRNPQNFHAMLGQKNIVPRIPLRPIPARVDFPIHLHSQPSRRAVEVEHIGPRRMLSAKPQALGPIAQDTPQDHLGQRQFTTQTPRSPYRPARLRRYAHRPSTMLRMVPLPKHSLGRNEVETHV
jgi:hypothetical protein